MSPNMSPTLHRKLIRSLNKERMTCLRILREKACFGFVTSNGPRGVSGSRIARFIHSRAAWPE